MPAVGRLWPSDFDDDDGDHDEGNGNGDGDGSAPPSAAHRPAGESFITRLMMIVTMMVMMMVVIMIMMAMIVQTLLTRLESGQVRVDDVHHRCQQHLGVDDQLVNPHLLRLSKSHLACWSSNCRAQDVKRCLGNVFN